MIPPRSPVGAEHCLQGPLGAFPKQQGFTKKAHSGSASLWRDKLGKQQVPGCKTTSDFLWECRRGAFTGTHPCTHPVQASEAPTLVQSDPWDHPPVRHTRGSNALSRTPSFTHSHMCAHTHRAELAASGLRQGGVSAVVAQQRGEEARPLLEGGPCEGADRGQVPGGPAPTPPQAGSPRAA